MKNAFRAALAVALLAVTGTAHGHDGVHVTDAFALISPAGGSGAVFMVIDNHGGGDDRLIAADSPDAERVELHTHEEDAEGVMRMVEVVEGFVIPSGGERRLERGGDHVMLMGLTRALSEGDTVTLTLTFEREGTVTVEAPVGAPAAAGAPMQHGH